MKKPVVVFRKIWDKENHVHGLCEDGKIHINLMTNANPARTYIHELTHFYHPDWSENRVLMEESRRWRMLNTKERFKVYRKLFDREFRKK